MGKKILLVEDHPANILVATTLLEDFGYHYQVASSGEEALEKIRSEQFSAALMDIKLSGVLNGVETVRRLRAWEEDQKRHKLPIIAMTAYATVTDRDMCLNAGMDDYIAKPFDPEDLRNKLEQLAA